MKLYNSKITGVGIGIAKRVIDNNFFEKIVETSDEWIRSRSGIIERRFVDKDESTIDVALDAARQAIKNSNTDVLDIDLIIFATTTADYVCPPSVGMAQDALGAKNAAGFDLNAGCSGLVYAIITANQYIATGNYKKILVIGAEAISKFLNFKDRSTCILFGDGASAVIMERNDNENSEGIIAFDLGLDGSGYEYIIRYAGGSRIPITKEMIDQDKHWLTMQGKAVFKFAVSVVPQTIKKVLENTKYSLKDVDMIIPHQANNRIIDSVAKQLELPSEKFYTNIQKYGNTAAASVGIALKEAIDDGKVKKGDLVILVGFGTGLTYATCLMRI